MFFNVKYCLVGMLVVSMLACRNEQKTSDVKNENPYQSNAPEYICIKWSQLLDSNKIEEAKLIATDSAKVWLDSYAKMLTATKSDTVLTKTVFDTIYCKSIMDSCTCYYLIKIDGESLKDSFQLVRINGSWKMGVPPVVEEDIFLDQDDEPANTNHQ